MEYKYLRQ